MSERRKFKLEAWRKELYQRRSAELYHHGILGQKWGQKNGPPYPLGTSNHSASERKAGWRKSLGANSEKDAAKERKRNTTKIVSGAKKSVDRLKKDYHEGLKAQYLEKHNRKTLFHKPEGKTEEDAEKYAKGREKVLKTLLVVGGVSVTAAAAYYAYNRFVPEYIDRTLASGTTFRRVTRSAESGLNRAFYMARSKRDREKYVGLYGKQIRDSGGNPHQLVGKISEDMKIASNKKAAETFRELYESDYDFRKMANKRIKGVPGMFVGMEAFAPPAAKVGRAATDRINSGQTKTAADFKNLYEAFNIAMTNHGDETDSAVNKFYDALKRKGYGAINDINDQKYSGYNTRTANIVFDVDHVVKTAVRDIGDREIDSINAKDNNVKALVNSFRLPLMGLAASGAIKSAHDTVKTIKKGQEAEKEGTRIERRKR